jgi:hypothetical protein
MLEGISYISELKKSLVFKGGTAHKKCWFGNYRFSQHLIFTAVGTLLDYFRLEKLLEQVCEIATNLQSAYGSPIKIDCNTYLQSESHPFDQKASIIMAQFPWHRDSHVRVMVYITVQELLIIAPEELRIVHMDYQENLSGSLKVDRLE